MILVVFGNTHIVFIPSCRSAGSFSKEILLFIPLTVVFGGLVDGGKSEDEVCTAADVVVADDYGVPLDLH